MPYNAQGAALNRRPIQRVVQCAFSYRLDGWVFSDLGNGAQNARIRKDGTEFQIEQRRPFATTAFAFPADSSELLAGILSMS